MSDHSRPAMLPIFILANGKSRRFGAPKSEAQLGERRLIEWVYDRVRPQTHGPVMINSNHQIAMQRQVEHVPDVLENGYGPLAGVHAAMHWAQQRDYRELVTVTVDTPFLPHTLISTLLTAGAPSHAASGDRKHPLIAVWRSSSVADLEVELQADRCSAHAWLERCGARSVDFESEDGMDPFFNINTEADLEIARNHLHTS